MAQNHGRVRRMFVATVCTLAIAAGTGTPMLAVADDPTTSADAKTQVEALQKKVTEIDQQYAQIQDRVTITVSKIDARNAEIRQTEESIESSRKKLGRAALTQYQTRGSTPVAQMVAAPDSDRVLSSLSMVDKISADQTSMMQRFQADKVNLAEVKRQYEADLASAEADKTKLTELDNQAKQNLEKMKELYGKLSVTEAAALRQANAAAASAPSIVASRSAAGNGGTPGAAQFDAKAVPSGGMMTAANFPRPTPWNAPSTTVIFDGNNNYAWGNCTWYVAARRAGLGKPIGPSWGNANMWPGSATAHGYTTGKTPVVGAMYVEYLGYYGHVAVIEWINPDGSFVVSEMNNAPSGGGLGIINFRLIPGVAGTVIY